LDERLSHLESQCKSGREFDKGRYHIIVLDYWLIKAMLNSQCNIKWKNGVYQEWEKEENWCRREGWEVKCGRSNEGRGKKKNNQWYWKRMSHDKKKSCLRVAEYYVTYPHWRSLTSCNIHKFQDLKDVHKLIHGNIQQQLNTKYALLMYTMKPPYKDTLP
jgi:hypothetical protein